MYILPKIEDLYCGNAFTDQRMGSVDIAISTRRNEICISISLHVNKTHARILINYELYIYL